MKKEVQLWRRWGQIAEKSYLDFLCTQVKHASVGATLRETMRERLLLFRPADRKDGEVWWYYETGDGNPRATACGFLAAMAESEIERFGDGETK